MNKKASIFIKVLVSLYLIFLFRSIGIPQAKSITEFHTKSLKDVVELEKYSNWLTYGQRFNPNLKGKLPEYSTLRQQLSFQFPYEPSKPFQKNIWQTWKVGKDDPEFPKKFLNFQSSWDENNSGYVHSIILDGECEILVNSLYETVPDVAKAYNIMPKSILKADFFRYLILYAKGGIYSDIDTVNLKPVSSWASMASTLNDEKNTAGLAIGIEADPDRPDWADWYARRIQFCQWTIQAKLGHPMLRELIARITEHTLVREANGQLKKVLGKDEGGDIMNWTGPGLFTDIVFEYLNNVQLPSDEARAQQATPIITWESFTGLTDPKLVADVMILPITSFSPGVGQMGAQSIHHALAYVQHIFLSTWKPMDERM